MKIRYNICQKTLATIWLLGSLIMFVILVIQTYTDKYGDHVNDVWAWFLPSIMPTLLLIVGVLGREAVSNNRKRPIQYISRFFFIIAAGLSILYILTLTGTITISPWGAVDRMQKSSLFLGPFQGLVTLALGVLFTDKKEA